MKTNTITISSKALSNNISIIKQKIGTKKLCAVVKADAYGLGCKNIVPLLDHSVDCYAVASVDEAIALRDIGVCKNILVLGVTPYSLFGLARKHNIELSIPSIEYINGITGIKNPNFHLQLNTGLNRFGIIVQEVDKAVEFAHTHNINIVGAYTHFATTSNDKQYIDIQYKLFRQATRDMDKKILRHCSNTYASIHKTCPHEDMVRVGFGLYGSDECGLMTIFKITAKILNILTLEQGESLGYDRTFFADRRTKVAVVSLGYADGLSRGLSNKFWLYVKGKFVPIIGQICMDVCFIDVSDVNVSLFDDVEILGDHITLKDYATALNTSPYEILLNFGHLRADTIVTT